MKLFVRAVAVSILATLPLLGVVAEAAVPVVAAENFYGDVARQIGGPDVTVVSILSNPSQDPHTFEASASVARAIAGARIVIANGVGYDAWMTRLLGAARANDRTTIVVGDLVGKNAGDNPHLWYSPPTTLALARQLAADLGRADPPHAGDYASRLAAFQASLDRVTVRIAELRSRLSGFPVTATEPVCGYLLDALGMTVRNQAFQLAVMNGTEPGASEVAAFETDLRTRRVKLLVYNSQASSPVAARMEKLARASGIPVVGVTETEPAGKTYQVWMSDTLDAIGRALPP